MSVDGGLQLTDTKHIRETARDLGYPVTYSIVMDRVSEDGTASDWGALSSRIAILMRQYGEGHIELGGKKS